MSKSNQNACPMKKTSIGGQALLEGIMMRGPKTTAMAVRNTQGEIVIEKFPTVGKKRAAILRWPIIRGVVNFADSMSFGYKCIMRSAEISGLEELEAEIEREKAEKKAAKQAAKEAKKNAGKGVGNAPAAVETPAESQEPAVEDASAAEASAVDTHTAEAVAPKKDTKEKKGVSTGTNAMMIVSLVFSLILVLAAFMVLPAWLYNNVLAHFIPWFETNASWMQSIFEGGFRVILITGYMTFVLCMKEIRRTFRYHGAEHKTIFCYEHGLELTVENVRSQKRFHPRCGTSFLVIVILVSVLAGFLIPVNFDFLPFTIPEGLQFIPRVICKLALFLPVMGIAYELIKICGRYDNWFTRLISFPGLLFQRITVLEPDDSMIECAIAAMKEVIPEDNSDSW